MVHTYARADQDLERLTLIIQLRVNVLVSIKRNLSYIINLYVGMFFSKKFLPLNNLFIFFLLFTTLKAEATN